MISIIEAIYSVFELTIIQWNTGLRGADFRAVATIVTFIGIYYIFRIGRGDGFFRAFRDTGVTHDAIIVNFVSQKRLP